MSESTVSTDKQVVAELLVGLERLARELGWRWEEGRGWVKPGG